MRSSRSSLSRNSGEKAGTSGRSKSAEFYHLDLADEQIYLDVEVDEWSRLVRFHGVDFSMQCMDLLLHICSALHLNIGDYLIMVPAESLTGDENWSWRCAPPSSKLSDWIRKPKNKKSDNKRLNPNHIRLVPKSRVHRFAKFDNCYTYRSSSSLKESKSAPKSGREFLKDLGHRVVIYLPHNRKLVARTQMDVPIMEVIEKISRERGLDLNLLCLTQVRTGKLLDPWKSFKDQNVKEFELKECQPGQSNILVADQTIKLRHPNPDHHHHHKLSTSLTNMGVTMRLSSVDHPIRDKPVWSRSTISSMISVRSGSEEQSLFEGSTINSEYRILTARGTLTRNQKKRPAPLPPKQLFVQPQQTVVQPESSKPVGANGAGKILRPRIPQSLITPSVGWDSKSPPSFQLTPSDVQLEPNVNEYLPRKSEECQIDLRNSYTDMISPVIHPDVNASPAHTICLKNQSKSLIWATDRLQSPPSPDKDCLQLANTSTPTNEKPTNPDEQLSDTKSRESVDLVIHDCNDAVSAQPESGFVKLRRELFAQHAATLERSTDLTEPEIVPPATKHTTSKLATIPPAPPLVKPTIPQSKFNHQPPMLKKPVMKPDESSKMKDFMAELTDVLGKLKKKQRHNSESLPDGTAL